MTSRTRRPHGTGAIETRRRDYHILRFDTGVGVDGKRIRRAVAFHGTKKEAEQALREAITLRDSGTLIQSDQATVSELLEEWLEDGRRRPLKESTLDQYQRDVRLHYLPAFGKVRLGELRPGHIQQFIKAKQDAGLASQTVRRLYVQLHTALEWAVKMQWVTRNVADSITSPRGRRAELHVIGAGDVERLLQAALETHGTSLYSLIHLAVEVGPRRGELLALRWEDIDFDRAVLRINGTIREFAGRGAVLLSPKTARSRRAVSLSSETVAVLKEHRAEQNRRRLRSGGKWVDNDLVWPSEVGTYWLPRNMIRAFKQAVVAAGLPHLTFHSLRHTAVSLMIQADVPITAISAQVGHANPSITHAFYADVLPGMQHEAAERVSALRREARSAG